MRIALVGTDLAAVHGESGALERLLTGWAGGLGAAGHDVFILSVAGPNGGADLADASAGAETLTFSRAEDLAGLVDTLAPDAVVINNRPAWQRFVSAPTVHLMHNWPDAWDLPADTQPAGSGPARAVGGAALAAVSPALAATVAAVMRRKPTEVGVVTPYVDDRLLHVAPSPEPGLVVCPNRLMIKKGIAELVAASARPQLAGRHIEITDYLSPWPAPTVEHVRLRNTILASGRCRLIRPPHGRAAMAALYARAEVVVCPSIRPEGLGLTAIEAQAVGIPVVSSGLGGLADATLLPELIVDPNDPGALARAIVAAGGVTPTVRAELRDRVARRFGFAASLTSFEAAIASARPASGRR